MNSGDRPRRPRRRDDFEIAIICALPLEREAVGALLEERYETDGFSYSKAPGDSNAYTTGCLGNQPVVLVCMPGMGTSSSAAVAVDLRSSFRGIRLAIVFGVCGGVPTIPDGTEILLGDVIVSTSVVQIDLGRKYPSGFRRKNELEDTLGRANPEIRAYIRNNSGDLAQARLREKMATFSAQICAKQRSSGAVYPGPENDRLYPADHLHKHWIQPCDTCEGPKEDVCESALQCDCVTLGCGADIVDGRTRIQLALGISPDGHDMTPAAIQDARRPAVHIGRIASSNTVMKSGVDRDRIAAEEQVIGFEMEAAGTWDYVPTIVIKGVCDYADSHKSKQWQAYAAVTAAACTKAMLEEWRSIDRSAQDAVEQGCLGLNSIKNPVHWTLTQSANTLFVGRSDLLDDLSTIVGEAVKNPLPMRQCTIVISGMGGQGKSELSLQLAYRVRTLFWGVFWVDVSTRPLAENGFLAIAKRLKLPAQNWEDGRRGLSNLRESWILVLDNADDLAVDYQVYFPPGPTGIVLLTSRNHECQHYATARHVNLEGLPTIDARELLLKAARVEEKQRPSLQHDADKVVELLHSHPLALIQAGAYVALGRCTLAKYPEVYTHQRKRLLGFRPKQARSRYGDVYATFEASIEILNATSSESATDALELLPVLAVCGPTRIPLELFEVGWKNASHRNFNYLSDDPDQSKYLTTWHISHLPSLMQVDAAEWDPFRLTEALQVLKGFALVSVEESREGESSISMHPLVHAWARDRQDDLDQHKSWVKMGCLVAVSSTNRDFCSLRARQLQPHLHALTTWSTQSMFGQDVTTRIVAILSRCARIFLLYRDFHHVSLIVEKVFGHLNLDQSHVSQQWVALYGLKGVDLLHSGRVKEAAGLLTQVVEIQKRTLAEEDPDRLASIYELARVYHTKGQVNEALALLEEVVEIQKRTFAEEDPNRLASIYELARVYHTKGQVNEALALLEEVVEIEKRTLAEEDPDRLASMHELARVYHTKGQVNEALALLVEVAQCMSWRVYITQRDKSTRH